MKTLILAFVFATSALTFTSTSNVAKAAPFKSFKKIMATTVPVTGSHNFSGNFTINRFITKYGKIWAVGTLTGTYTDASGHQRRVNRQTSFPVTDIRSIPVTAATCPILHLELGPLNLNVLGLRIHLDKVVLDITAQQGGGLLGDLLCDIANLLSGGGTLGQIVNLLNQILAALG